MARYPIAWIGTILGCERKAKTLGTEFAYLTKRVRMA
jgi:hypothetical protein